METHSRLTDQQSGRLGVHLQHGTELTSEELEAMADRLLGLHRPGRRPDTEYPVQSGRAQQGPEVPAGVTDEHVCRGNPNGRVGWLTPPHVDPTRCEVPDDVEEDLLTEEELSAWLKQCERERELAFQRGLEKWGPVGPGAHLGIGA